MTFDPAALPDLGPVPDLAPVSRDRVAARLDARGYNYGIDDDGDIGGRWDDHVFFFLLMGSKKEYLQVRGRWARTLPASELGQVLVAANEWASSRIWPKIYVNVEDGNLGIYAEHAVDYEYGVTDGQLDLHLGCAISTSLAFFEALDARYPQEVAAAKAEIARLTEQSGEQQG
ncbi:YbjN domain-containing protein [Cellulomonas sp. HZM]|uniref:YbjN domain-containing protein n=1 Tax=Cellulomonas sp. HZM TaxID=1454010 RepID=UPI00068AE30C|nr:YbjN domain-containing protein [Cellulomonas sp. HZM]